MSLRTIGISRHSHSGPSRRSPNNHMQRAGRDKVHAPDRLAGMGISGSALQVRRAAADVGR